MPNASDAFDFVTPVNRQGTYCTQWDYIADRFGRGDLLPFTISDMDFMTAPCIIEAVQQRVAHGVFGYSRWNHADFQTAVYGWFAQRYQATLPQDSLVYGPSVIYIIAQLIAAVTSPHDGILMFTPAYDGFYGMLNANQRTVLPCPLDKTEAGTYEINWGHCEHLAAQPHCRVMLLCNPHNPTGRVWSLAELTRLADIGARHNLTVISDDIHMDMAYTPYTPWSEVALNQDWALVTSASKSFNIPALGGAYGFIADPTLRDRYLTQLKQAHGLSSPPILGIIAHMSAYQAGAPWLDALKQTLQDNLQWLAARLAETFPILNYQVPEGTYLAWIDLNPLQVDRDQLQQRLIHHYQVAIMPGDAYGPEGRGYVRLNVGCPRSKVVAGTEALIHALQDLTA